MAISEAARNDLYTGLSEVLGPDRTETLMNAIPLHDLDEVATKRDIAELRVEIAGLRTEMRTEIAQLQTEMAQLRTEMRTEIAQLRTEFKTDLGTLRGTLTNWMLTLLVAMIGAMVGVGFLT